MKLITTLCFLSLSAMGATNYVCYSTQNNRPLIVAAALIYDSSRDTLILADSTMGCIDWSVVRVASFTDAVPKTFTNVNQVAMTPVLPWTANQKSLDAANQTITPAVKALMDLMNETRQATNQITAARLTGMVTNKIEKSKSVQAVDDVEPIEEPAK